MEEQLVTISDLLHSILPNIKYILRLECSARTEETLLELFPNYYKRSPNEAMWQNNEFGKFYASIPVNSKLVSKGKVKIIYNNSYRGLN